MDHFERWQYHIGLENQKGEKLTKEQLRRWTDDSERMFECTLCQIVEPPGFFQLSDYNLKRKLNLDNAEHPNFISITCCPRCREYNGIQPHIPGWSDFE